MPIQSRENNPNESDKLFKIDTFLIWVNDYYI